MTTATVATINRYYQNFGMHAEQALAYTLTGEIRKHDHIAFDKGSDIPEFNMSVKSAKATLASGRVMTATTWEGQIDEYFSRVHSTCFAYVTTNGQYFVMNAEEFREFLLLFSYFDRDSTKNGGLYKVKLRSESKALLGWLTSKV